MIGTMRRPAPLASMNITNLVDVCMTLLIIFMLVAPAIKMSVDLELPKGKETRAIEGQQHILVSIEQSGNLLVQNMAVSGMDALSAALKQEHTKNPDWPIFVQCDKGQPVEMLYQVMAEAQAVWPGGKIGLLGATKGPAGNTEKKDTPAKTG